MAVGIDRSSGDDGDRLLIEGGHPISGSITPSGNKNEALPLLAASLLVSAPCRIDNVPRIRDVDTLIRIMRGLGVHVEFSEERTVVCDASTLRGFTPDAALSSEIRGSFLLAAPLLARLGQAVLPRPGGDKIGRRRLDTHLLALRQLGAELTEGDRYHLALDGRFRGAELFLDTMLEGTTLHVPARQKRTIASDAGGAIPKIDDAPWPGFPADLTPLALVLATQCEGTILIHEKLFESRLFFVDNLIAMGARVVLCDPHRAVTIGPSQLHAATIVSPDIRAGMALIAAALGARGQSVINNVRQVDRGYERIAERLQALGARLVRERASV